VLPSPDAQSGTRDGDAFAAIGFCGASERRGRFVGS
jgi:hypothetical protein